ncbi:probable receptor-like serine/threonine-protein kinase At4g34500 [Aegilops tauschii subsp. strangulata]|uniref:Protein kinase domain-containing protein n=2 Tax=Aegilops tauschii TaxID=37682 RepID=A0A453JVM9_AEGTS|nr:probable receptor-like serine/threonine-protein kinase At4g34500 [Aegilops tauschii subsp. strangulata]
MDEMLASSLLHMSPPSMMNHGHGLLASFFTLALCGTGLAGWLVFGRTRRLGHVAPAPGTTGRDEAGQGIQEQDCLIQQNSGAGLESTEDPYAPPTLNVIHPWLLEVNLVRGLRHENIITLVPPSTPGSEFVYEHAENASLDKWLHPHPLPETGERRPRSPLTWPTRRAIAIGVAGGLSYLHEQCIIHHNINSSNVLLDRVFKPKITGFGHAQTINIESSTFQPLTGNFGYAAPDYVTMIGELTEMVDVYSFGVVLLELVTGRAAVEFAISDDGGGVASGRRPWPRVWHLPAWAHDVMNRGGFSSSVVDMAIPNKAWYMREMEAAFKLAVDCTIRQAHLRPSMERVLKRLRNHGSTLSWIKSRLRCCLL